MAVLKVTDLESNRALDRQAMKAVRGGFNFATLGGQNAGQSIGGGFGFFSPITAVNAPVNIPISIQLDNDTLLGLDSTIANVIGSANTGIAS